MKLNNQLYFDLKGKIRELFKIGDSMTLRSMEHAIWEGEEIGRAL